MPDYRIVTAQHRILLARDFI
uniref:Uncharacterized protein n=1 Tax=Arundo donax TaxID=35708 RepID=A0A0A9GZX2_ARUDO